MMLMTSVILGVATTAIAAHDRLKRVAFPRIKYVVLAPPAAFLILLSGLLLGGFPFGWTGTRRVGRRPSAPILCHGLRRGIDHLAGFNIIVTVISTCARHALEQAAVPLGHGHPAADGARGGAHRRHVHAADGPDRADRLLREPARRQQLPVPERVLVLRAPRGVHPGAAGVWGGVGDHSGVLPKTAVRLPDGRGGHDRRGPAELLRLAASPVRQRDQPGHAAAVHADHGADLDPDRVHLPGGALHVLESESGTPCRCCCAGLLLPLPHRRHIGVFLSDVPADTTSTATLCWRTSTTRSWAASSSPSWRASTTGCPR